MKITNRFKAAAAGFLTANNNIMGRDLAREFLKRGNAKPLIEDWSKIVMSDRELYSGYPYAAINKRANKAAYLAIGNIETRGTKESMDAARAAKEELEHPYLEIIDKSRTFSNFKFWHDISVFLDLEGVYYLMAVRNVAGEGTDRRVGEIQYFKMLNPYDVRRIRNKETDEIGGYVEARDGMVREIPPGMIIEIRDLNPFSLDEPYSMTDAAKSSQFTLKQAGDYTRHSLKNNMAAPGIISTDVLLDPAQFANFVSRVTNQEKGLPLFGNGAGAITWDSMQIDMDKAALDKINEINRSELFAVSGVGKTNMAIEESGTTRETAKVQKDILIEDQVMPRLQSILDAFNQDYKNNYEAEYEKDEYEMYIDNPLGSDREAELKDVEIRKTTYSLYDSLVADGYDEELAAKYAAGEIGLEELGKPTNERRPNPVVEAAKLKAGQLAENPNVTPPAKEEKPPKDPPKPKPKPKEEQAHEHDVESVIKNEFEEESQGLIATQQGALQNAVVQIEAEVTNAVLNKITKNAFDEQSDIMSDRQRKDFEQELAIALAAFYGIVVPLFASMTMNKRAAEFGEFGNFKMNNEVKKYIKEISTKASESHINTILNDLLDTAKETYDRLVQDELSAIEATGRKVTDADLVFARKKALEGKSQAQMVSEIKKKYTEISKNRAKAIARTETNRAFTQSQYQADLQFIKQNGYEGRAYKQWITTSDDPCPTCRDLANRDPVPFETNFADLGEEIVTKYEQDGKTKVKTQLVNFEPLRAGNAHVNCGCKYKLIIK